MALRSDKVSVVFHILKTGSGSTHALRFCNMFFACKINTKLIQNALENEVQILTLLRFWP